MRVLVTGGAGFIGSHLLNRLLAEDNYVTVLDNFSTGRMENIKSCLKSSRLIVVDDDVRNFKTVRSCMEEIDSVVHLAAIASIPYSIANPIETVEVNVIGTTNLLKAAVETRVDSFIFASSSAVYGEAQCLPMSEQHPLCSLSPYAASKIAGEHLCQAFHESYGIRTVSLRVFNVYGTRWNDVSYSDVIAQFVRRLIEHKPPIIYGDGEQSRDFIYIDDVVATFSDLLRTPHLEGTYNLGSGKSVTINQLAEILFAVAKLEPPRPLFAAQRPGEIKRSQADVQKLKAQLGFCPETTLEEGLEKVLLMTLRETGLSLETSTS